MTAVTRGITSWGSVTSTRFFAPDRTARTLLFTAVKRHEADDNLHPGRRQKRCRKESECDEHIPREFLPRSVNLCFIKSDGDPELP